MFGAGATVRCKVVTAYQLNWNQMGYISAFCPDHEPDESFHPML